MHVPSEMPAKPRVRDWAEIMVAGNPFRSYKLREQLSVPELAKVLEISPSYANKLSCGHRCMVSPPLAWRFEQLTDGGIRYHDVMHWIYEHLRSTLVDPPESLR